MKDKQDNEKNLTEEKPSDKAIESTSTEESADAEFQQGAESKETLPPETVVAGQVESETVDSTTEDKVPSDTTSDAEAPVSASSTTQAEQPVKAKKSSLLIAIFALIIAIVALAGGGYLYQQMMAFQATNSALQEQTDSLNQTLQQIKGTASSNAAKNNDINSSLSKLNSTVSSQKSNLDEMQQRLTNSIKQISQIGSNSRKDWLLAESEYLLRLANQRVLLENSPVGALALMKSADEILKETDDVSLYNVRKAIAMDIAALEAVPKLDVDGVFLKLVALNEHVDSLSLLPVSESPELPDMLKEVDEESLTETWQQGLKEGWNSAMDKLGSLIIIQHRDESIEPLLTHEQGYFIQQNLHLMIEQAQMALLQGHQQSYDASLKKATEWIGRYFRADDSTTQALIKGLNELKPVEVSPELPDISGSLRALKQYFADIQTQNQ